MSLSFILLALAIVAAWLPPLRLGGSAVAPWTLLFAVAVAVALADGALHAAALLSLAALCLLAWGAGRTRGATHCALIVAAALLALVISLHLIPGFPSPPPFDYGRTTPDALPFTLGLRFDKAAAGLVLLAAFCRPARGDGVPRTGRRASLVRTAVAILVTPAIALGLASALGITRLEPHWPDGAWRFLAANLLFTCVAEEAFFRGIVQERLLRAGDAARAPGTRAAWRIGAIVVATALFTAAHRGADPRMTATIAVAGLGYGLAQLATRRIESAIATHFAVNAAHFLLFAYPALAR